MNRDWLKRFVLTVALTAIAAWLGGFAAAARQTPEQLFTEQILPVLKAKCQSCHGEVEPASQLDLTARATMLKGGGRGPAVIPGDAANSLLFIALTGADERRVKRMPPGGKPLGDDVIEAFRQWINAGAPWPETGGEKKWAYQDADVWAFKPLKRVSVPAQAGSPRSQGRSPVDAFIRQKLKEQNLLPAPAADRVTLLRRATFDLHGLPPTPDEVNAFVNDKAATPAAFKKVVERLLASPRYGERWGRHWLDVVRYADTGGGSNDYERPTAWRYRDYVIRSFNQDKPYDQFILEQLAGDELDAGNAEHLIATGFLRMGPWEHTGMSVEAVTRQEWLDDVTHTTATAFLALTMGCAKCHNHKFDPIPAKDYYSLQAVFATTRFAERPAAFLPDENLPAKPQESARLQAKLERALLRQKEVSDALGIKPRSQPANAQAQAAAPPKPPTQAQPFTEAKRSGNDPRRAELLELERAYLKRVEFGKLAVKRFEPLAFSVSSAPTDASKPATPEETFVLVGGNLGARGEKVDPAVPSAPCNFTGQTAPPIPTASRRLALAKWIASRDNPLTSRVMVNRIWQWHFGKGLVETANNFGKLGKRPSHPELLDYLAAYFVEQGWSVKAMHRLLMNSDVYQQAGAHPQFEAVRKADPENRLLAYFPPRRLEAEELRDAMLSVAGALNLEMGGPGAFPALNADLIRQPRLIMGTVAPAWEPSATREARNRRAIYTFQQRSLLDPLVEVFNGANPNESCEFRRASTIAPQVFALLNSQFSADAALAFAERLEGMTKDRGRQIEQAFLLTVQRRPTVAEKRNALQHLATMTAHHAANKPPLPPLLKPVELFINSEFTGQTIRFVEETDFSGYERNRHPSQVNHATRALAELCLVLMNANEFVYVY